MEAKKRFSGLLKGKFDLKKHRYHLWRVAALCRRLRQFDEGIRLLGPVMHRQRPPGPTAAERAQYAALLIGVGAVSEAQRWLGTLDGDEEPNKNLFLAFAYISHWDYARAVAPLLRYIHHPKPTDYDKLVARTNLVHVLVSSKQYDEANSHIESMLKDTRDGGHWLLHGNILESAVVRATELGESRQAEEFWETATKLHQRSDPVTRIHLRLRRLVLNLNANPNDDGSLKQLEILGKKAREFRSWEMWRLCDWYHASFHHDPSRWAHLFYGTPYRLFKQEIRDTVAAEHLAKGYCWTQSPLAVEEGIDLETGLLTRTQRGLPVGKLLYRLLWVLARDFYRPIRTAEIFEGLYAERPYHPTSSPLVVRQAIYRLRHWLNQEQARISIRNDSGAYTLVLEDGVGLWIAPELSPMGRPLDVDKMALAHRFEKGQLLQLGDGEEWSVPQLAKHWNVSLATARRYVSKGLAAGELVRIGKGRNTRYRFNNPS